jgi:hypothetical protein
MRDGTAMFGRAVAIDGQKGGAASGRRRNFTTMTAGLSASPGEPEK